MNSLEKKVDNQLQLIADYSTNLNSLKQVKAKINSQILNTKNAERILNEPVDFHRQSTFEKNNFSSFNISKQKTE